MSGYSGNRRKFIDGEVANFYRPTSLGVEDNLLYILDFDTVRRVITEGVGVRYVETLVGFPVEDINPEVMPGKGYDTALGASELGVGGNSGEHR